MQGSRNSSCKPRPLACATYAKFTLAQLPIRCYIPAFCFSPCRVVCTVSDAPRFFRCQGADCRQPRRQASLGRVSDASTPPPCHRSLGPLCLPPPSPRSQCACAHHRPPSLDEAPSPCPTTNVRARPSRPTCRSKSRPTPCSARRYHLSTTTPATTDHTCHCGSKKLPMSAAGSAFMAHSLVALAQGRLTFPPSQKVRAVTTI